MQQDLGYQMEPAVCDDFSQRPADGPQLLRAPVVEQHEPPTVEAQPTEGAEVAAEPAAGEAAAPADAGAKKGGQEKGGEG